MLEVRLFGQFEVVRSGSRLTIPTRQAQSLFAYLILNAEKSIRREKLAGLLWPDSTEENARSNLRHELWRLRKALNSAGETYLQSDDLAISFSPGGGFSLDVQQLEQAPVEGSSIEELMKALSVNQGELLPGFYEEWVLVERERLSAVYEAKIARLLELLQAEGRWTEVAEWARRWIAQGGWPEPAYRALLTAYAAGGELSKAVTTYERYTQGLQKELGVKPSEQSQLLNKRIKAGWKPEAAPATPSAQTVPVPEVKAALTTPPLARRRPNLPRPLTSFVGREKEIQQVERLVSRSRLVTITGSGGVGKTRLAIQVASALTSRFRDGAWWVELAPLFAPSPSNVRVPSKTLKTTFLPSEQGELTRTDLVAQTVAKALRFPETPGVSLLEGILEYLNNKRLLLVLDNCEHLIDACATLAQNLLNECPEVTILATSREALGVPGEKAWDLPSLSLPVFWNTLRLEDIHQSEAVSLFIERAADVLPGYQPGEQDARTIAYICKRLDGIPLAIELAAARMNLLSPQEIADRLDSRFNLLTGGRRTALPRHQTLRAAIEWSYDLLSESEKVLFHRLSVFAGSFTLEAAEVICEDENVLQKDEVLSLVGRLVDKSLVIVEPAPAETHLGTRYRLLDTIQSFGRLKLEAAGETVDIQDRHSAYYVRLVEAAKPEQWLNELRGIGLALMFDRRSDYYISLIEAAEFELNLHNQKRWYKLLQAENDNLRAVVEWGIESDHIESALRVVGALLWYWYYFGSPHEGRDLSLRALGSPSTVQNKEYRAKALNTAGFLQVMLSETTSARQLLEEALSILRTSDDEASLAWSLQFLGLAYTHDREYELADASLKEGSAIAKKLGDVDILSFSFFQGDMDLLIGDHSRAKMRYEESVSFQRSYGNKAFLAYPLRRLGYIALEDNDIPAAKKYFQESLTLNQDVWDKPGVASCLTSLAVLAMHLGKLVLAARLVGVVEKQLDSYSMNLLYLDQAELERIRSRLHVSLDKATFEAAYSEGWAMSEEQAVKLVNNIFKEYEEVRG